MNTLRFTVTGQNHADIDNQIRDVLEQYFGVIQTDAAEIINVPNGRTTVDVRRNEEQVVTRDGEGTEVYTHTQLLRYEADVLVQWD